MIYLSLLYKKKNITQNNILKKLLTIYQYIFWINSSKNNINTKSKKPVKNIGTQILSKIHNHIKKLAIKIHCLKLELIWLTKTSPL